MKLQIMHFFLHSSHFIPNGFKYHPYYLFSNTLNLCLSLYMRDQVSYPYKTTATILMNVIFWGMMLWSSRWLPTF